MEHLPLTLISLKNASELTPQDLTQIVNAEAKVEAVLNSGAFIHLLAKEKLDNLHSELMQLNGVEFAFDRREYERKRALFKNNTLERTIFIHLLKQVQLRRHGVGSAEYILFYAKAVELFERVLNELFKPASPPPREPTPGGSLAA